MNTILPGTAVSVIVNVGEQWVSGRSLIACEFMPRVSVVGPFTLARLLRVGQHVRAVGAVVSTTAAMEVLGTDAASLVDRVVSLDLLWPRRRVDDLYDTLAAADTATQPGLLSQALATGVPRQWMSDSIAVAAVQDITRCLGAVSIERLAKAHALSRQHFTRRFRNATGLPPKQFARLSRFQALVPALLSTDVRQWATLAPAVGFYDQAHMINEFRALTGMAPTSFFQPHTDEPRAANPLVRGRPHEWFQNGHSPADMA